MEKLLMSSNTTSTSRINMDMNNTEKSVSEDFKEWQQIQHPFPETSPAVSRSGGGWNTVVISENYLLRGDQSSILPANNHDALQIIPTPSSPSATSSSSETFESDEDESPRLSVSDWRLRVAGEGWRLMKLRFEAIRNGVVRGASRVRNCTLCAWAFWSIAFVAGVATAAVLMVVVYTGIQRRRRRDRMQRVDCLVHRLREKDERIRQLMLQIAELNEVLSARRKVPVLRISS